MRGVKQGGEGCGCVEGVRSREGEGRSVCVLRGEKCVERVRRRCAEHRGVKGLADKGTAAANRRGGLSASMGKGHL